QEIRVGDRAKPRDDPPVAASTYELRANRDATRDSLHNANDRRCIQARRHEVDHTDLPLPCLPFGLKDERPRVIVAPRLGNRIRSNDPAALLAIPEQCGKTGVGGESRETAPVDRTPVMDEHRPPQIRHKRVTPDQWPAVAAAVTEAVARGPDGPCPRRVESDTGCTSTRPVVVSKCVNLIK